MIVSHLQVEEPIRRARETSVVGTYLIAKEGQTQFSEGENLGIGIINQLGTYLKDSLSLWDRFLHLIGYHNWKPITVRDPSSNDLRIVYFDVKVLQKVQRAVDREFKRLTNKGFVSKDLQKELLSCRVTGDSFSSHSAPNMHPLICNVHKQLGVCYALLQKEKRLLESEALLQRYEKHLRSHPTQSTTTSNENPVPEGQGAQSRVSPVNFPEEGS